MHLPPAPHCRAPRPVAPVGDRRGWARRLAALAGALGLLAGCSGPALLSVEPTAVAAGGTIALHGAGFSDAMAARLEGPAGGSVSLAVHGVTADTARATLPAATPEGVWDVVVSVGGAEARLPRGLTVQRGQLTVHFLDVGQGDATLVIGPDGSTLLFDGGNRDAGDTVVDAVHRLAGDRLDAVAVSHTDADHLGGVVHLLRGIDGIAGTADDLVPPTRWIGHDDVLCDSALCDEFRGLRARFERPLVGDTLDLGGAQVEVLGRDGDFGDGAPGGVDEENERSLALRVSFAGRSVFVAGDLTGGGLGTVDVEAAAGAVAGPVDVLRLNHHGSATSSSSGFLRALQPRAVVVSVGTDNAFCHPETSVVERLAELGAPVWATGAGMVDDGSRCDGVTVWPPGARVGRGTLTLVIGADGAMSLDDEPL